MKLSVKRLNDQPLPAYAKPGDAGLDLRWSGEYLSEGYRVQSDRLYVTGRATLFTGLAIGLPPGHVGLVLPRSGLARTGLVPVCGVIDSGFTGEVAVLLEAREGVSHVFSVGDRIAQLVVVPCPSLSIVEVAELKETERADSGFGSSGR